MLEVDSSGVVKATGNLQKFAEQAKKSEQTATSLDDVMNQFNMSVLASSAGVAGLLKAFQGLANGLKGVIGNFAHFESMQKNLETFFQSADLGKEKFEELRKLSNQTTFGVDELANSFTQLANVGAPVDEINDQLTMLGNLASGDKTRFAELVSVYSKILSTGKAGSMQLQQIATKGIPIYDMLKQMGVTGTASAEDITKAFEKMTEQGGQFYNAMNNINDTIAGKEGFISDYFKEMTVNFAEASGIADVYKNILDKVRDVIGAISDKLLELNQNPVMKALFSGVIFGAITALVTVIGTSLAIALKSLITKLIAVNTQLAIKSALSGPVGWASLALAGVVGLGAGIATLVNEQKKAEQSTKDWGTTISSFQNTAGEYKEVIKDVKEEMTKLVTVTDYYNKIKENGEGNSYMDSLADKINELKGKFEVIETYYHNALDETKRLYDEGDIKGAKQNFAFAKENKASVDSLSEEIQYYESLLQTQIAFKTNAEIIKKAEEARKKAMQEENELLQQQLKTVEDIYKKTNQGKLEDLEKQIREYSKVLTANGMFTLVPTGKKSVTYTTGANGEQIPHYTPVPEYTFQFQELTDEQKKFYEVALKETQDAKKKIIDELNLKAILDAEGGWRKIMQDALGLTDDEMLAKGFASGNEYINDYIQKLENTANTKKATSEKLGINQASGEKEILAEEISALMSVYNKLLDTGQFGVNADGTLDNTSIAVQEALERLKTAFIGAGGSTEEYAVLVGNSTEDLFNTLSEYFDDLATKSLKNDEYGAYAGYSALSSISNSALGGSDVGTFLDGLVKTGDPLVALIDTVVKDLAEIIGNIDGLDLILNPVMDILKEFTPLIKTIFLLTYVLLQPIKLIVEKLGDWLEFLYGDFADAWDDLADATDDETERIKRLNEEYDNLLSAMKEQEEYYLEQKQMINADTYASGVYKVNDMILTPHGNFSTAPDDYIIATKNPNNLGGNGSVNMIINIENQMGSEAKVTASQINESEMLVVISRQIASDYASGNNGWKSAYLAKQNSLNGRNVQ